MNESQNSHHSLSRRGVNGDWFLRDYPPGVDTTSVNRTTGGVSRPPGIPGSSRSYEPVTTRGGRDRGVAPKEKGATLSKAYNATVVLVSLALLVVALVMVIR